MATILPYALQSIGKDRCHESRKDDSRIDSPM
jgi:hypothetical protein